MEKLEKLMLPATLILLLVLGWIFFSNYKDKQIQKNQKNLETTAKELSITAPLQNNNNYETKTGEMGAVTLEITPLSISSYNILLNTHSVDLGFDYKEIIKLKDNLGNTYDAISWSGESGGHHLEGQIVFPEIDEKTTSTTITVSGIENQVLNLNWEF